MIVRRVDATQAVGTLAGLDSAQPRTARSRQGTSSASPPGCQAQSLDLVFLLDASASVGRENFAQMQSFIRKCTLRFDVNPDVTQVGLVVYGSQVQTAFGLDAHPTRAAVRHPRCRAAGHEPGSLPRRCGLCWHSLAAH